MKNAFSIIGIIGILFGLVILNLCFLKLSKSIIDDTKNKIISDIGKETPIISFAQESKLEQSQMVKVEETTELRKKHDSKDFEKDNTKGTVPVTEGENKEVPIIPPRPMQPAGPEGTTDVPAQNKSVVENKESDIVGVAKPVDDKVVEGVEKKDIQTVENKDIKQVENKENTIVENKVENKVETGDNKAV